MKLALDIDDVLAKFVDSLKKFHNEHYKTNFSFEDFHTFRFNEVFKESKESTAVKMEEFNKNNYEKMPPYKEAQEAVKELSKKYELIAITSRSIEFKEITVKWLRNNFPEIKKVLFSSNPYINYENKKTKAELCIENNVLTIVEDDYNHAKDCSEKGIKTFLINRPWNQENIKDVIRVNSWNEILNKIDSF